jgi:hypothetical protein
VHTNTCTKYIPSNTSVPDPIVLGIKAKLSTVHTRPSDVASNQNIEHPALTEEAPTSPTTTTFTQLPFVTPPDLNSIMMSS